VRATDALKIVVPDSLVNAVLSQDKVDEPPHSFYKYPARFSPAFAREAIKSYTIQGDTVLDPFCGGGTSLVEAISLGRRAAGFDISSLAVFVARAKTTPLSIHDKSQITEWSDLVAAIPEPDARSSTSLPSEDHYSRNLPVRAKAFFEAVLELATLLSKPRQQRIVRLVLLSVGQCALDCKTRLPSWSEMRDEFSGRLASVLANHYEFLGRAAAANNLPRCRLTQTRRVINRSSEDSDEEGRIPKSWLPAKLILTSPPYPGVHVLYHRWQINGRRETPAPFWLANSRDGAGAAHYCLGRRDEAELSTYYRRLGNAFSSVRELLSPSSIVVQLVAFSKPEWQLPAYLQKMQDAGFVELTPVCNKDYLTQGRLWRQVPGRKWYAKQRGQIPASKEVLLVHRLA